MSTPITFNSVAYSVPQYNDTGYAQGAGNLSSYLVAISTGTLQQSGGAFTLTADVNFGTGFGLIAKYYTSATSTPATAGAIRLANADLIEWRNFGLSGNNILGVDSSDRLVYNGGIIPTGSGSFVSSITGTANQVIASSPTGAVTLSLPQSIAASSSPAFAGINIAGNVSYQNALFDVNIAASPSLATSYNLLLPLTQGAANSFLKNDGSGNLSFAAASGNFVSSITGTANQIIASASTGAVTLSTPQDIGTASDVTFNKLTINKSAGTTGILLANGSNIQGVGSFSIAGNSFIGLGATDFILSAPTYPGTDNFYALGKSINRWTNVHSLDLTLYGSSSGNVQIAAPSAPTSYALALPTAQGSANQTWINNGSGAMSFATLPVAGGGSGNTTFTAYSVICAGTTATGAFQNVSGVGSSGQVLTSNGAGALPTWQTLAGTGTVNSGTATHLTYYATSTNAVSDANGAAINGTYTLSGGAGAITMSGSTIAMGTNKITGLAAATTSGDALRYEQLFTSGAVTLLGNLAFTTPGTMGITGSTSTTAAAAGNVGEEIRSNNSGNNNATTSGNYGDATSLALTAGAWMLTAQLRVNANAAVITSTEIGISTTSGNSATGLVVGDNYLLDGRSGGTSMVISNYIVRINTPTTYYMKYNITYSAATPLYQYRFNAVRIY